MGDTLNRPIAKALSPTVTGLLARTLGEATDAVRLGVRGALTAVFRALNAKASTEAGAGEVLSVARDHQASGAGLLRGLEARLRQPDAGGLLAERSAAVERLFSGRASAVAAHLASFSKVKPGSAGALLTFATELALAALNDVGPEARDAAGLRRLLRAEQAEVRRTAPRGFDPDVGGSTAPARGDGRWLPWTLAALSFAALAGLGLRTCQEAREEARPSPPAPAAERITPVGPAHQQ